MYIADLPRDLGVTKKFSGTPGQPEERGVSDIIGDFGVNVWLIRAVELSRNGWQRDSSIDGDTFEGLLPM